MDKTFKIPVCQILAGTAYVRAQSLDEAIEIVESECSNGRFTQECDWDNAFEEQGSYKIDIDNSNNLDVSLKLEKYQNNLEDLYNSDNTSIDTIKDIYKEKYNLAEEEFNAIEKAIKITQVPFAIDQFYNEGYRVDAIYDFGEDCYYSLKEGVQLLLDAGCGGSILKKELEELIEKLNNMEN